MDVAVQRLRGRTGCAASALTDLGAWTTAIISSAFSIAFAPMRRVCKKKTRAQPPGAI
jgi:hypothetical protein